MWIFSVGCDRGTIMIFRQVIYIKYSAQYTIFKIKYAINKYDRIE